MWKRIIENEICDCQPNNTSNLSYENISQNVVSKGSKVGSYLTGIIYPLLFVILAIFIYSINETSLIGMIIAICFDIAAAIIIIMGGFYLLVIPLPYISFYKVGCIKHNLPKVKKIIFGILSFVLLFGSVAILFLFSQI